MFVLLRLSWPWICEPFKYPNCERLLPLPWLKVSSTPLRSILRTNVLETTLLLSNSSSSSLTTQSGSEVYPLILRGLSSIFCNIGCKVAFVASVFGRRGKPSSSSVSSVYFYEERTEDGILRCSILMASSLRSSSTLALSISNDMKVVR